MKTNYQTMVPARLIMLLSVLLFSTVIAFNISAVDCNNKGMGNPSLTPQNQTSQDSVYTRADEFPEFPGGLPAMKEFYVKNIKYPEECMENGTEGRVVILIIIEKDGSVTFQKILKSAHPLLDNELIRVIKKCPKYTPAKINGNPVRFNMVIPYEFKL